jgi:cell wall-associated NlpC family hydrolase
MNLKPIQTVCLLLFLSSCKSLQHITSRDNSSNQTASTKKDGPEFLDDVSITPGEKKNAEYNSGTTAQSKGKKFTGNTASSNFNIEKADWLQIKYAIMTDMPVEQLNNLPLLQQIDHWWGTRYCMGGNDEDCIDCSAFTRTLLHTVYGVEVSRTAHEQYSSSTHINAGDLSEGDLVFFKSGKTISHVGLYLGNNKFVHASTSFGVMISDLNESYWSKKYAGAGRVRPLTVSSTEMR